MNEVEKKDAIYELYRLAKRIIEKAESHCGEDHSYYPSFLEWKNAIKIFDGFGRGYAEKYEKEKKNELGSR